MMSFMPFGKTGGRYAGVAAWRVEAPFPRADRHSGDGGAKMVDLRDPVLMDRKSTALRVSQIHHLQPARKEW